MKLVWLLKIILVEHIHTSEANNHSASPEIPGLFPFFHKSPPDESNPHWHRFNIILPSTPWCCKFSPLWVFRPKCCTRATCLSYLIRDLNTAITSI